MLGSAMKSQTREFVLHFIVRQPAAKGDTVPDPQAVDHGFESRSLGAVTNNEEFELPVPQKFARRLEKDIRPFVRNETADKCRPERNGGGTTRGILKRSRSTPFSGM